MSQELFIASDHAGFSLKKQIINALSNINWKDLGTHSTESVDYPDYADKLCQKINQNQNILGVLICGSGQGMCMRANKYPFIRATLGYSTEATKLARAHNNANVLCLAGRALSDKEAYKIIDSFINTSFKQGRHTRRVKKLTTDIK